MELKRPHATEVIQSLVPPLTVWAIEALLETRRVKRAVNRVDEQIERTKRRAERSIARVSRNAVSNRLWLAAGVAVIATGIGLMATAATKKK